VKVKPPEGFGAVYLPTKEFEMLCKKLKSLGYDVDVRLELDREEKAVTTVLEAEKTVEVGGYSGQIVVLYVRPHDTAIVETNVFRGSERISHTSKEVEVAKLISELKHVENSILDVARKEEETKKQWKIETEKVAEKLRKLGFETRFWESSPNYVSGYKKVGKLEIAVGFDAKTKSFTIRIENREHKLTWEELISIIEKLNQYAS